MDRNKNRRSKDDVVEQKEFLGLAIISVVAIIIAVAISAYFVNASVDAKIQNLNTSLAKDIVSTMSAGTALLSTQLNTSIIDLNQQLANITNNSAAHSIYLQNKIETSVVAVLSTPPINNNGTSGTIYLTATKQRYNLGTGFSIDKWGDIITANHVVANDSAPQVFILFRNLTLIGIRGIIHDPTQDLAVLIVNTSLPSVQFQNQTTLLPSGTPIGFIGYPTSITLNNQSIPIQTSVEGTIAASVPYSYQSTQLIPAYYIGASVNFGNSGGPVFSLESGKIIGIINQRFGGSYQGLGISTALNESIILDLLNYTYSAESGPGGI